MSFDGLMTATATILRKTVGAQSASGRESFTWNASSTAPGRIEAGTGKEIIVDRQVTIAEFVWFTPFATDVTERDRVIISGNTYEVLLVNDPGGAGHHKEVHLKLVRV